MRLEKVHPSKLAEILEKFLLSAFLEVLWNGMVNIYP